MARVLSKLTSDTERRLYVIGIGPVLECALDESSVKYLEDKPPGTLTVSL